MKIILFTLPLLGVIALGTLAGCNKQEIPAAEPETVHEDNDLRAQVAGLPLPPGMDQPGEDSLDLPPLDPISPAVDGETIEPGTFDGLRGVFINKRHVYTSGFAFDELSIFNPAESQIYPGSVFVGSSITSGEFAPLPGTKGEVVWAAHDLIPGTAVPYVVNMVNPKSSDFSRTTQQWFSMPCSPLSATTIFDINEVSNSTEMGEKLGVGFQKEDIMAHLKFEGSHQKMKTHVLVKAVQRTFSIACDIPDRFILKSAKVEDMKGVMPVYVSEVFYGRMAYAVIHSNHEYHDVVAALNLNVPSQSVDLELEAKYKQVLDSSLQKTYLVGGSSEEHGFSLQSGWDGLKRAISSPLTPAVAKPIAYTLRYVHNNAVARVVLTSDFTRTESYFVPEMEDFTIGFTPRTLRAKANNEKTLNVYGDVTVTTEDGREQVIFRRERKDYFRIDDSSQETPLSETVSTEVTIHRPSTMSMKDFLSTRITLRAHFANSWPNGRRDKHDLGTTTIHCSVRDLLFSAMKGRMNLFTQAKHSGQCEANLIMDVEMNNGIRVVGGTFSR